MEACKLLDLPAEKTVMVGDRLTTDILGGNRAGLKTIWVKAFDKNEPTVIRGIRFLERLRAVFMRGV